MGEKMKDYYRDMDLATNATPEEIRGQFKRLAKEYHPDKNNSDYAKKRFAEINEAYNVLNDPQKRQEYDFHRNSFFNFQRNERRNHMDNQTSDSFFSSPMWSQVKTFATGMAQNFVEELDKEIQEEYSDIDPFVERVAKVTTRHNKSGSLSLTCNISSEDLKEITSLASRGMDIEEFSADVGTLLASHLSQALLAKWRGY